MAAGRRSARASGEGDCQMEVTATRAQRATSRWRMVAWIALAAMIALFALGPTVGGVGAVTAVTSLHQTPPIASSATGFEDEDCDEMDPGDVLWHFVLVQTSAGAADSFLHATFAGAGDRTVEAYKKSGGVLHFNIITGADTLLGAHTNRAGRWLNLSHICVGPPVTTTTSSSSSSSTSTSTTN